MGLPRRLPAVTVLLLVLASGVSGCLGDVKAVYVPDSKVPSGWLQATDNETSEAANGLVDIVLNQYKFDDRLIAEVYLIAVTDVPFVDEHKEVEKRVKAYAEGAAVELTKTGTSSLTLDNGKRAKVTEYEVEKSGTANTLRGEAWLVKWETKDFVGAGLGFATTEYEGLFGVAADDTQWKVVQGMLQAADW